MAHRSMYNEGEGVELDDVEAIKWYAKSAEQGSVDVLVKLSTILDSTDKSKLSSVQMERIASAIGAKSGKEASDTIGGKLLRLMNKSD